MGISNKRYSEWYSYLIGMGFMKKIALGTLAALSEAPEGYKWNEWKAVVWGQQNGARGGGPLGWGLSPSLVNRWGICVRTHR